MMRLNVGGDRAAGPISSSVSRMIVTGLMLVALAGTATAQSSADKPSGDPVLRGPRITDNSPPGERGSFGGGRAKGAQGQRPIPQPAFMKAVMALNADGAAAETRLSTGQEDQLKAIEQEFRDSQREFITQHGDQVRELAGQLPPEDRARLRELFGAQGGEGDKLVKSLKDAPGKKPKRGGNLGKKNTDTPSPDAEKTSDGMMAPPLEMGAGDVKPDEQQTQAAREKFKSLMEQAPRVEQARGKMWAVLSEPQRQLVEGEIKKAREEMQARQIEESKKKKSAGGRGVKKSSVAGNSDEAVRKRPAPGDARRGPDAKGGPALDKPPVAIDESRVPAKVRERLKDLPPEQREEAIKKIRENRAAQADRPKRKAGKNADRKRKAPSDGAKPPPPIDQIDIPKPDNK